MEFVTIVQGRFDASDRAQAEALAFAEIEARGWHGIVLDFDTDEEDLHWHDFASVVYVISGQFRATNDRDEWVTAGPGTTIEAPARVVHREQDSHYRGVIGIDMPLEELTQPLNKPLELLAR